MAGRLVLPNNEDGLPIFYAGGDAPQGSWQQTILNLGEYAGQRVTLEFSTSNDNYYASWMAIDDICVQTCHERFFPTNLPSLKTISLPCWHSFKPWRAADAAGADTSEINLRRRLTLPGFDPLTDQILAQNLAGETVGQTGIWLPPESDTAFIGLSVHPESRRQGLGSQLLEFALSRGRMLGARRAALNVWQPGAAGHFFLRQHGLKLAGHFTRFSAPLPLQAPLRGFPAEFTIRTFAQVTELETLARAFEQCYSGLWGHHSVVTLAELQEWLPQMDPEGILLVYDASERVVGMCRVEINAELSTERGVKLVPLTHPVGYQPSAPQPTPLPCCSWLQIG